MPNRFPQQAGAIPAQKPRLLYTSAITFQAGQEGHLHAHEFTELFYILEGGGRFLVRSEHFAVQKNDFVIVLPGTEHAESSDPGTPLSYIVIGLEGISLQVSRQSSGFYKGSGASKGALLSQLLLAMVEESTARQAGFEQLCDSLFQVLLVYILRMGGQSLLLREADDPVRSHERQRMIWVKQYLDEHLQQDISLADLEPFINLNRYTIIRYFKQAFGVTPMRYLMEIRFNEACFYLETSDTSIRQIAELCGFHSSNYFTQIFEKHKGMSPSAYRRLHRGKWDAQG